MALPTPRASGPPRAARYPALDAVRGLAALAVVGFHAYKDLAGRPGWETPLGTVAMSLQWAVPVFFVLSGFLLYRPFAAAIATGRDRPAALPFLVRRAFRILPAYWLALLVFGTLAKPEELWTPDGLVRYGLLVQVFDADTVYHVLGTAWSLSIEGAFYLALPLLAWLVASLLGRSTGPLRHLAVIAGLTAVAIALRNAVVAPLLDAAGQDPNLAGFTLAGSFQPFAGGMALAVVAVSRGHLVAAARGWPRLVRRATAGLLRTEAPWLVAAAGAYVLGLVLETRHIGPWSSTDFAAIAAVALLAPLVLRPATSRLGRRLGGSAALVGLGAVSYGLYLWHWPIQELARTHGFAVESSLTGWAFGFATMTALGLVAAVASHRLLEAPINDWVRSRLGRRGRTAGTRAVRAVNSVGGLESGGVEEEARRAARASRRRASFRGAEIAES
ncbi:MAG TPA: acyltransferase [Candidatus Limnocylindrales bacterium]|nr:acyltransferase [Candidatus Limnocylindrales bacterium]